MYKHLFLNPFYWYAVIWSSVLLLYPFNWTEAYPPLCAGVRAFFLLTIAAALFGGNIFAKYMKRVHIVFERPRYTLFSMIILLCFYAMDFAYARHIPLLDELLGSEYTYMDFKPMPIVHMLAVTFSVFYGVFMFYCFMAEKDKRQKVFYLACFLTVMLMLLCLYNRGALIMQCFMCVIVVLSMLKKIKPWHIAVGVVAALLLLYLFGVMGNIRSGDRWNETTYFIGVAQINTDHVPGFVPSPFLWAYVYLITPLGNLNNYIMNFTPEWSAAGVLSCILPDSISNRLLYNYDRSIPRVLDNLTVSSGFAGIYKFGGYLGMVTLFVYMVVLVSVLVKLSVHKPKFVMPVTALCCCITAFMFFENYLIFMGVLFAFAYPMVLIIGETAWRLYRRKRGEKVRRMFDTVDPRLILPAGYTRPTEEQ